MSNKYSGSHEKSPPQPTLPEKSPPHPTPPEESPPSPLHLKNLHHSPLHLKNLHPAHPSPQTGKGSRAWQDHVGLFDDGLRR
ncbi:hypothetical protein Hamer_G019747 [Homarus americanus]|uniref:Uncharacterized protein n=1 Tax=Homarus americanus TaxID=6706 RepID=A0A8J5KAG4_HOMAM|nr:hypothetical protein Hamer_G019747 [Homarus americanus]